MNIDDKTPGEKTYFKGCLRIMKYFSILLLVVVLLLFYRYGITKSGPASGTVLDAVTGKGIDGAFIKYKSYYGWELDEILTGYDFRIEHETFTDDDGSFYVGRRLRLRNNVGYLNSGTRLHIYKPGYYMRTIATSYQYTKGSISIGVHENTKSWMGIGKAGFHKHVKEDYGEILLYPYDDDYDPCEDYKYIAKSNISDSLGSQNNIKFLNALETVYQEALAHECYKNNHFMQQVNKRRGMRK